MARMNTETFTSAQQFFTQNQSIHDLLKALPPYPIAVRLDGETHTLAFVENAVHFSPEAPAEADVELQIGVETLRRWEKSPPQEITQLVMGFVTEMTLGHSKIVALKPVKVLREKHYFRVIEKVAPQVQGELLQKGMVALGEAQGALQMGLTTAKFVAQNLYEQYFGKKK